MNQADIQSKFQKKLIATRYYLRGAKMFKASKALDFALKFRLRYFILYI